MAKEENFEEFDEFESEEDIEPKPEPKLEQRQMARPNKGGRPPKAATVVPQDEDEEEEQPKAIAPAAPAEQQPQYVAVPRAVPVETMLNSIYDSLEEVKQAIMIMAERLDKIK